MNNKFRSIAAFGCVAVLGGILADVAIAQQSRSDTGQLEEIVVTAEKRESTIETTAISLTAVSGADILDPAGASSRPAQRGRAPGAG
jgi:outer membrane cobalamin receptor